MAAKDHVGSPTGVFSKCDLGTTCKPEEPIFKMLSQQPLRAWFRKAESGSSPQSESQSWEEVGGGGGKERTK